jgi:hypothetical protein
MRTMKTHALPLLLLLALAFTGTAHAQPFSSLQERMSAAEFKKAGLDKLSPGELHTLNAWLRSHVGMAGAGASSAAAPVVVGPANQFGYRRPIDQPRATVESTLPGRFSGWDSHTQFSLANGQVWQVSESSSWSCQTMQDPKVTIKPMLLGSWLMYIQGCSNSVRVERVH